MTAGEKKKFIRDLCASVRNTALEAVSKMPEEWDGIELREYLAAKFTESSILYRRDHLRQRAKAYTNEMIVRNL